MTPQNDFVQNYLYGVFSLVKILKFHENNTFYFKSFYAYPVYSTTAQVEN